MTINLAKLLGIRDSKKFADTERLLRFFFLRAKSVEMVCEKIKDISFSRYVPKPQFKKAQRINNSFSISRNKIFANSLTIISEEPCKTIEAYLIHAKTEKKLSLHLRYLIKKNLSKINHEVRNTGAAIKTFLEIFKGNCVYETLFIFHQDGVLDRFIPEFGALRFLVVDDPFHSYTVDAHSLLAIKELEHLSNTKDKRNLI
ncbi:MAG: hypothetical protein HQK93_05430, partial [Nitrospirae bacterium]|nr:hypothetical protein [Nitrospirota bacterium]